MKYSELIEFEPLTTVIKLENDNKQAEQRLRNVETYVFSKKMEDTLCASIVPNLDTSGKRTEQKGISVVGSFGTGKSHLMSVISSVAEDAGLLAHVHSERLRQEFKCFAGKYKVLRFEVGTNKPLDELVRYRIEKFLGSIGCSFKFDPDSKDTYKEQLQQMMAAFEEKFPDSHLLIVIDELLEYLRSRKATEVNGDLMTLRQMGEMCDGSRFKLIYGVQELLYRDPFLAPAADMLNKVSARFDDVLITKEDVAFVVKNRLLKKTAEQKQRIREHLNKFSHLFDGLNTSLNDYVELFPVHPSYITVFQQIKHGKDKREILKILSGRFLEMKDKTVPEDNPGLITYDSYFEDMRNDASLLSIPDIAKVKDKLEIIEEKINGYFNSKPALKSKIPLARRIANALAIRVLCDDLDKCLGANALTLKEDLCLTVMGIDEGDLLKDTVESTAEKLVSATQGQYVIQNEESGEFSIRTEGGINVEQVIKDFADYIKEKNIASLDQEFFNLLKFLLGIESNPYRPGFNIWKHYLEWKSTRHYRLGYIFFGNPNERSTTEPVQEFYLYFCPLFSGLDSSDLDDEVYFDFSSFGEDFRNEVCLYAASIAKESDASSDMKKLFHEQVERHRNKAKDLFNKYFMDCTKVLYKGTPSPLKGYQPHTEGGSKLSLFSDVAATILDSHFNAKFPDFPQFKDLQSQNTPENLAGRVKSALTKIIRYSARNRDGEAILTGLGLSGSSAVDLQNSRYAASIKKKLAERGEGKVLNRDDVIQALSPKENLYYSVDYRLEYQLEFVVLAALVFNGDIEVSWSGETLTASNISEKLLSLDDEEFYLFNTIKAPSDLPVKALKKLFSCLGLPDLTASLKEGAALGKLAKAVGDYSDRVAKTINLLQVGISCNGIALLEESSKSSRVDALQMLLNVLDKVRNLDTYGKLKGFKYTEGELEQAFGAYSYCEEAEKLKAKAEKFEGLVKYLSQAKSYVLEGDPLYGEMDAAVKALAEKLNSDEKAQKQYEANLRSLADSYADYYLAQYSKHRLGYEDAQKRDCLLNSEKRQICEILKDVSNLNKAEFENWRNAVTSLKAAQADVTKEKIKQNPYQDFNPRESTGECLSVRELEEQLDSIYDRWETAIKSTFNDPGTEQNLNLLKTEQKVLAAGYKDGTVKISLDNSRMMRDIVNSLSNGFEPLELSEADFAKVFFRPMGVDEAKKAFEEYIDNRCSGKERNKIRIILSGK